MIRLKELREDRDLLQKDIAIVLHTTQQQYYRYENGIRELRTSQLMTLCEFYGVSADYLLGFDKALPFPDRDID